MPSARILVDYNGVQVHDIWQNIYLVSADLLTIHDLRDCEYVFVNCKFQAEYFLNSIEPASTKLQVLQEIYNYAKKNCKVSNFASYEQIIKELALMLSDGYLKVFKVSDGFDIPVEAIN